MICAVSVALTFFFRENLVTEGRLQIVNYLFLNWQLPFISANGWGLTGACSLIVILGTLANLASVASSIVVYKDWIVIIAGGDSQRLAGNIYLIYLKNMSLTTIFCI